MNLDPRISRLRLRVLRLLLFSAVICSAVADMSQASSQVSSQVSNEVQFLDQGWTDSQRQTFYTLTQGSQMMPLVWFTALERSESEDLFLSDNLARFGYLTNPASPDHLPVGFTRDENGGTWVGLTCAACHTSRIEKNGVTLQIDGGPTNADIFSLLSELDKALRTTIADDENFTRFAARATASTPKARHDLRNQLTRFSAYFSTLVDASTPDHAWGPGRTDAFGMIFNRVSAIDLSDAPVWAWFKPLEENNQAPNAPVSYPFLWGTSRENFVQWNAIAPNTLKYERLERNIVEALGVFGRINLTKTTTLNPGYRSTVNATNQWQLEENLVHFLKSPQWPEAILGPIDTAKANQGKTLFKQHCSSCHALVDRNSSAPITVKTIPVADVATDPAMTTMVACRTADTGALAGFRQPPITGHKLEQTDFVANLAASIGVGVIENWLLTRARTGAISTTTATGTPATGTNKATKTTKAGAEILQSLPRPFRSTTGPAGTCQASFEVYKAGPLNGIWATGSYLHNGSVPNLYQLLLPSAQRKAQFKVGSRKFDSVNVGFDAEDGSFLFDTTLPGNSNAGHPYGTQLSDDERWQLVEYLKTL